MSFLDSIKEFFGSQIEGAQDVVAEHVNVEDIQQKAEEVGQNVGDTAGQVGEEVGKKVEELKEHLPGQQ